MPGAVAAGGNASEQAASSAEAAVSTAFSLGWQMSRLYESPGVSRPEPKLEDDLPGLSALPAKSLTSLGLEQADEALKALSSFLNAGETLPVTKKIREALDAEHPDEDTIRKEILSFHVELLVKLTAADFRLGKAYGLGRALADTCAPARGTPAERRKALEHHLEPHRALVIVGWLDDLRTMLADHAGHATAKSLERWIAWGESAALDKMSEQEVNDATHELHRQGQRWRAILSGEKACRDLLSIGDYVTAGQGMLVQAGQLVFSFAHRLWLPLSLAAILILGGITLVILDNSTSQVLAGLGTVAGGLGITWKSATSSLGHLSVRLGEPLWQAELDVVIAERVTSLPQESNEAHPGKEKTHLPNQETRRSSRSPG